jgi:hypothetical protein
MKKKIYTQLFRLLSVAGIAFICFLPGCQPTQECGTWTFTGTPGDHSFSVSSAFDFTPANCGKDCNCTTDCIIQMVWAYNEEDGTNVYASDQSGAGARATSNGWTIDQLDGWAYAYYGLNNDGTFDTGYNPPGSNNNATTLFDTWCGPTILRPGCVVYSRIRKIAFSVIILELSMITAAIPPIHRPAERLINNFKTVTGWNNWHL